MTPLRVIGWSCAAILATVALGMFLTVAGIAYETIRGVLN